MSRPYDVVVIGAGIIGLATALKLTERHPRLRLAGLDKEDRIGRATHLRRLIYPLSDPRFP